MMASFTSWVSWIRPARLSLLTMRLLLWPIYCPFYYSKVTTPLDSVHFSSSIQTMIIINGDALSWRHYFIKLGMLNWLYLQQDYSANSVDYFGLRFDASGGIISEAFQMLHFVLWLRGSTVALIVYYFSQVSRLLKAVVQWWVGRRRLMNRWGFDAPRSLKMGINLWWCSGCCLTSARCRRKLVICLQHLILTHHHHWVTVNCLAAYFEGTRWTFLSNPSYHD